MRPSMKFGSPVEVHRQRPGLYEATNGYVIRRTNPVTSDGRAWWIVYHPAIVGGSDNGMWRRHPSNKTFETLADAKEWVMA